MARILCLYDTELDNPLTARIRNIDYDYQGEQWVQDTAREAQTQNPARWVVRWELTDEDSGAVVAIWTRPSGDPGLPNLIHKSPSFTGTWELRPHVHKVYVAGTRHEPNTLAVVAALRGQGVAVTSTWHDQPLGDTEPTPEARRACAMTNYKALDEATVVVAVPCETHHLRGAHTEVGYALGKGIPVMVLGASGDFNTMTEHPNVTYCTLGNLKDTLDRSITHQVHKKAPTP